MTNATEQNGGPRTPATAVMTLTTGAQIAPVVPRSIEDAFRMAGLLVKAKMAPRSLETPEAVCVAIIHGLEVGMTPMMAVQSIAVVNGTPTIFGDGALALVRASGLVEYIREYEEDRKNGEGLTAVCEAKRKGEPHPIIRTFSEGDAKRAGLTNKKGPWQDYPRRMRQMRSRAWTLRDGFADVLKGLRVAEEVQDFKVIEGEVNNGNGGGRLSPPAPPSPPSSGARTVNPAPPPAPPQPSQIGAAAYPSDAPRPAGVPVHMPKDPPEARRCSPVSVPPPANPSPPAKGAAKGPTPQSRPNPAAVPVAHAMPDPARDPDSYLAWLEAELQVCGDAETLGDTWDRNMDHTGRLGAAHEREAEAIYDRYVNEMRGA